MINATFGTDEKASFKNIDQVVSYSHVSLSSLKGDRLVEVVSKTGKETLKVNGIDGNGAAYDLFKGMAVNGTAGASAVIKEQQMVAGATIPVKLQFQGHYGEKELTLAIPRDALKATKNYLKINIVWSPYTKQWETALAYDAYTNKPLGPVEKKQAGEQVMIVEPKAAQVQKQMAGLKLSN